MAKDSSMASISTRVGSSRNFQNRMKTLGFTSIDDPGCVALLSAQVAVVEEAILVEEGYNPGLMCLGDVALGNYYDRLVDTGVMYPFRAAKLYSSDRGVLRELAHDIVLQRHAGSSPELSSAGNHHTPSKPEVGDRMEDGTIYAGISPDTGKAMYTTPEDAPLRMEWKRAMRFVAGLDANGHHDWRVPTKGELNVLFNNRSVIGGFVTSDLSLTSWYLSSAGNYNHVWVQHFCSGNQYIDYTSGGASLRCVRG